MATALYALSADESPRVSVTPTEDDADLVGRALLGDRTAEALIYRRHARAIAGLAARLSGSRSDAEDIVQETFVRALEHLRDLRDPNALRPWLTRIAVTCAQRRLRRKKFLGWFGVGAGDEDLVAKADEILRVDAAQEAGLQLLDLFDGDEAIDRGLQRGGAARLATDLAERGACVARRILATGATMRAAQDERDAENGQECRCESCMPRKPLMPRSDDDPRPMQ